MKPTLLTMVDGVTSYGMHGRQIAQDLGLPVRAIRTWRPKWGPMSISSITNEVAKMDTVNKNKENHEQVKPFPLNQDVANPENLNRWELLLYPPGFCPTKGKRTVYFSMHESTRLPPLAVELFNRCERVIVPCEWNACNFSAQGIDQVSIVPLGVNERVFRYRGIPDAIGDLCVFGCAGRMANGGPRKGINQVIEAFAKAFPFESDVRLRVKVWPDCPVSRPTDPRVEIVASYLTEGQMADWFASIHCFVSAAKGEGWGLMQHQAMAIGRPVICANFGGISEFFEAQANYEVAYRLEEPASVRYRGWWALPSEDSMIARMREVYADRAAAISKGVKASFLVKHLTWLNHSTKLVEVLNEVGAMDGGLTAQPVAKARAPIRLRWRPKGLPSPLTLPSVCLWACCWSADRRNLDRTLRVLRYCNKRFAFGKAVLFSYLPAEQDGVEVLRMPELTADGWNIFHLKAAAIELMKTGKGRFLSVHEDGFPLDPSLWDDQFTRFDYVGAPWADGMVGNGGFCLESWQMLKAKVQYLPWPEIPSEASDTYVCRTNRKLMEDAGVRFAPTEVAVEFSTEQTGGRWPSFGFHGRRDQAEKYQLGWELIEEIESERS